ncbi:MAG TPA: hypothetical protein V6C58_13655, partial [Allocoleopsis sp.]
VRDAMGKIFDADIIDIMTKDGTVAMKRLDKNYPLMPFTKTELNEFHVPMNFIRANKISRLALIIRLQKKGAFLMKMIEEKYGIHS